MPDQVIDLQSHNADIIRTGKWLVDFWAPWCGSCRTMLPILDELTAVDGDFRIAKIDVSANPELGEAHAVRTLPTLLVLDEGTVTTRMIGQRSLRQLMRVLDLGPHEGSGEAASLPKA